MVDGDACWTAHSIVVCTVCVNNLGSVFWARLRRQIQQFLPLNLRPVHNLMCFLKSVMIFKTVITKMFITLYTKLHSFAVFVILQAGCTFLLEKLVRSFVDRANTYSAFRHVERCGGMFHDQICSLLYGYDCSTLY